jgi:hypothetical protein
LPAGREPLSSCDAADITVSAAWPPSAEAEGLPSENARVRDDAESFFARLLPQPLFDIFSIAMFEDFTATDRWTKKQVHCVYQALIVAIATRHADAVDIKFLADGKTVWVALPHPAWVEYKQRTGKTITDSLAVEIAGHYLKWALESGEGLGREMYSLTAEQTLHHLQAAVAAMEAKVPA